MHSLINLWIGLESLIGTNEFSFTYIHIAGLSADDDEIAGLVVSSMHFY